MLKIATLKKKEKKKEKNMLDFSWVKIHGRFVWSLILQLMSDFTKGPLSYLHRHTYIIREIEFTANELQ